MQDKDLRELQKLRRQNHFDTRTWNKWLNLKKPEQVSTNYFWGYLSKPPKLDPNKGILWIGIDPGVRGALGYFFTGYDKKIAGQWPSSGVVDFPHEVLDTLREAVKLQKHYNVIVAVEREWAIRKGASIPGSSSLFHFGQVYGFIEGLLVALNLRYERVIPYLWKSAFGLGPNKRKSLELARKMFPELAGFLCYSKDHNRAEALLIAKYMSARPGYYFPEFKAVFPQYDLVDI